MLPDRRSSVALRVALCCLLTFCGVTWCAAKPVSVSGQVVDGQGNPVPGVKVRLAVVATEQSFAAIREASQVSGKAGEYDFGPVETGESDEIVVAVYEPGKWIGWAALFATSGSVELMISKPTVVTGVVVDENGKPMSGAKVGYRLFSSRGDAAHNVVSAKVLTWLRPFSTLVTDSDGKFSLPDVPSHTIVAPSVSKEWYGCKSSHLELGEDKRRIVMVPAGSLTGRVVGPDGQPCPGAIVSARDRDLFIKPEFTDSDGVFRIDGVPSGSYEVSFFPNDVPVSSRKGVQVKAGAVTDLGNIAPPASVELSGRVLDKETGEPIEGAQVSVTGDGQGDSTVSGANGEYKLAVRPGEVSLCYDGGSPLYPSTDFNWLEVVIPAEGIHGHDIRLTKADQAHGRVLSAAGKPVPGAVVRTIAAWHGAEAVADSSGRFTIIMPREEADSECDDSSEARNGTVVLQARESKPNGQGILVYVKRDKLIKNGVTLTLAPARSASVSVVDKSGKPIAGAEVSLNAWVGVTSDAISAKRTDRYGKALFPEVFKGGRYGFSVSCVGYNDFTDEGKAVDSSSAKPKSTHKIVMTKADLVKGTVVDSEGKPVVGATVIRAGYAYGKKMTTGIGGVFKLFLEPKFGDIAMPDGWDESDSSEERIQFMAEDKSRNLGAYVSVEKATAIAKGVKIVLRPARELQVTVKDLSGKPMVGAVVSNMRDSECYIPFREQPSGPATNADGVAKLSVYDGMPVEATAEMEGYIRMGYSQSLPAAGSKEWTGKCEVILTPLTRTVEGKVVDTAGKPVKEANVSIALGQGTSISTDAEGRFKIDLPDSMVSLSASTESGEGSANVGRDDKTVTIVIRDY